MNQNKQKVFSNQEDDLLGFSEDSTDSHDILLDIDKMWDALLSCHDRILVVQNFWTDNLLREVVFQVTPLEDVSEYIAYTENRELHTIKLFRRMIWTRLKDFSMEACKKADLYPGYLGLS